MKTKNTDEKIEEKILKKIFCIPENTEVTRKDLKNILIIFFTSGIFFILLLLIKMKYPLLKW